MRRFSFISRGVAHGNDTQSYKKHDSQTPAFLFVNLSSFSLPTLSLLFPFLFLFLDAHSHGSKVTSSLSRYPLPNENPKPVLVLASLPSFISSRHILSQPRLSRPPSSIIFCFPNYESKNTQLSLSKMLKFL